MKKFNKLLSLSLCALLLAGSLDLSGLTSLVVHAEETPEEYTSVEALEDIDMSDSEQDDASNVPDVVDDGENNDDTDVDTGDNNITSEAGVSEITENSEVLSDDEIPEESEESSIEPENEDMTEEDTFISVDVSDSIVQAGGFIANEEIAKRPQFKAAAPNGLYSNSIEYNASESSISKVESLIYEAYKNHKSQVDIQAYEISEDELKKIFINVVNSHPDLFYVSNGYQYSKKGNGKVGIFLCLYLFDDKQCAEKQAEFDLATQEFMAGVHSEWCDVEKLLYINNYLAKNCIYDPNVKDESLMNPNSRSAYGCLVDHVAVCQGYALATNYLCHLLDVESCIINSNNVNHAWNLVKVDGSVYQLDVTWDDPVPDQIGRAMHTYFIKSNSKFANHISGTNDWACERGWDWSLATSTKYDDCIWDLAKTGVEYGENHIWYAQTSNGLDTLKCNTSNQTLTKEKTIKSASVWRVLGNPYGFWSGNFGGVASCYGTIYFSDCNQIYRLDKVTNQYSTVYELTSDEAQKGYIYGMALDGYTLSYIVAEDPNNVKKGVTKSFSVGAFEKYDIAYELNGGANNALNPNSYTGADDRKLYNPTKSGYEFVGWFVKEDLSGEPVSVIPIGTTKLYAAWKAIDIKVSFVTNAEGINVDPVYVAYDAAYGMLPIPARVNYDFLGWFDGQGDDAKLIFDGKTASTVINKTIGDHTLYAKWAFSESAKVVAPIFRPGPENALEIGDRITITTGTNGASIYYTTDGSIPDVDTAVLYEDEIEINKDIISNGIVTIKAIAVFEGLRDSDVVSMEYAIKDASDDWGDLAGDESAIDEIKAEIVENIEGINDADDVKASDIPQELWIAGVSDLEYTGVAVTQPNLKVYWGTKLLTLNTDYMVKYSNNVKAGEATVTITGKGNYTGTIARGYKVRALAISGAQAENIRVAYNKKVQKVAPVVTYMLNGKTVTLKNGTDYTVSYRHTDKKDMVYPYDENAFKMPSEDGYDIVITGKGNYYGEKTVKEMIYEATEVKSLSFSLKSTPFDKEEAGNEFGIKPGTGSVVKQGKTEISWDKILYVDKSEAEAKANEETSEYLLVAYIENNKAVGTAKITFTGVIANGYVGSISKTYAITGTKIGSATFPAELTKTYSYTGSEIKPLNELNESSAVYIKKTGEQLQGKEKSEYDKLDDNEKLNYDYTYEYIGDTVNAGSVKIVITGVNAYNGSVSKTYKISAKSISSMGVRGISASYTYIGDEITFDRDIEVYVKATKTTDEELLTYGEDYEVTYTKNINAGTGTVSIIGINKYTGTIKKNFKIVACNLNDSRIVIKEGAELGSYVYVKGGVKPTLSIVDNASGNEYGLVSGKDYTLSYSNNNAYNDGSNAKKMPTVTIKGKGNYSGSVSKTFTIDKSDLSMADSKITVSINDVVYRNSGNVCNPSITVTDSNGTKMAAGSDYVVPTIANNSITYVNDCEIKQTVNKKTVSVVRKSGDKVEKADIIPTGTVLKATVSASAKSNCNYIGSAEGVFRVIASNISSASVSIKSKEYTGKPVVLSKDDITITLNKKALAKTDYEIVSYTNNINKGTAKVTIHGIGNYGGTKTVNFTIAAKSMNYTIKYNSNNDYFNATHTYAALATGSMKDSVTASGAKLSSNSFKRTAYVFDGWNTKPDGTGARYGNTEKFGIREGLNLYGTVITLYAQWKPVEYKITYSLNKGPNAEENPLTYTIESDTITFGVPTRDGYDFGGWFLDSGFKKPTDGIPANSTGNKTVYAKWIAHKYNVYFNPNTDISVTVAGSMSPIMGKAYDATFSLPANEFKRADGFVFDRWNTEPDGSGVNYKNKASVSKLTSEDGDEVFLYAQWIKKKSYENPEATIWNFLMKCLGNEYGVAGLMGNLYAESGLRPDNLQNSYEKSLGMSDEVYTLSVDDRSYNNFVDDKAGYGLAQWTFYSRKQNLLNYAHQKGASISDLDMQLEFLVSELKSSYLPVWNKLMSATSTREAAEFVLLNFEKPKDQSQTVKNTRTTYADRFFNKYSNTSSYTPATLNDAVPFTVFLSVTGLNVREGPGTNYPVAGVYSGTGEFQIVETRAGAGSNSGWGRLPLGGWISLDYALKIK